MAYAQAAGLRFEQAMVASLAPLGYEPAGRSDEVFDVATRDRSVIVELKASLRLAPRDLIAAATQVALAMRRVGARRGVLVWWASTFSSPAVSRTWHELRTVLDPDVSAHLQLVMVSATDHLALPDDSTGAEIAAIARRVIEGFEHRDLGGRTDRSYEVLKLLVLRWLRGEPAISIGELQAATGLSHPTVALRIRELGSSTERTSSRAVRLKELPVRAWTELLALSPRVRQSAYYEDRSGRTADLAHLIVRLRRHPPAHVAIGGVVAAHHWQPTFDLVGIPRVDLEVHAPAAMPDLRFVQRLDPALVTARPDHPPVMAVHVVPRAASMFERDPDGVAWADPVETLLDLHQLRLHKQADEFVRYWRARR